MMLTAFAEEHLPGVIGLATAEGWPSLAADRARALGALTAPGVICIVALEQQAVIGFVQMITDGAITGYVCQMAVASAHRREGVGRRLIQEALTRSGLARVDLLAGEDAVDFYRSLPHREFTGFRIYPG